jgi:hypothetical protein
LQRIYQSSNCFFHQTTAFVPVVLESPVLAAVAVAAKNFAVLALEEVVVLEAASAKNQVPFVAGPPAAVQGTVRVPAHFPALGVTAQHFSGNCWLMAWSPLVLSFAVSPRISAGASA